MPAGLRAGPGVTVRRLRPPKHPAVVGDHADRAEVGGHPGAQLQAITGVEQHADARAHSAARAPPDRSGSCACRRDAGGGQRHHPARDPDADVVELIRPARRVIVVHHDDPLRDGHAAGRPGEQRSLLDQHREVGEVQAVVEHADVSAGDGDRTAVGDDRAPPPRDAARSSDARAAGSARRSAHTPRRSQTACASSSVRTASIAASSSGPGRRLRLGETPPDHLHAGERVAQRAAGRARAARRAGCAAAVRVGVRRVTLEHVEAATVEVEIARAAAQPPVDLGVVALALLPPGGDQRNRSVDPERRDLRRQVDPVEWPEQGHLPHEARTRTVSPTTLSM